jgi:hypothetical protein
VCWFYSHHVSRIRLSIFRLLHETLVILPIAAVASCAIILLAWISSSIWSRVVVDQNDVERDEPNLPPSGLRESFLLHVKGHGGLLTFSYHILRLLCGLVLLGLTTLKIYQFERVTHQTLPIGQQNMSLQGNQHLIIRHMADLLLTATYVSHI